MGTPLEHAWNTSGTQQEHSYDAHPSAIFLSPSHELLDALVAHTLTHSCNTVTQDRQKTLLPKRYHHSILSESDRLGLLVTIAHEHFRSSSAKAARSLAACALLSRRFAFPLSGGNYKYQPEPV